MSSNKLVKVKKAALQMQHILQAGMAYDSDNNKWPEGDSDRDAMTPPFNQTYIGPAIVGKGNPWGNKYEYVREPGMVNTFGIRTVTPNVATAQAVAALLPMAYTKDATVYAYVNQAGMGSGTGNVVIMGRYLSDPKTVEADDSKELYAKVFTCPQGMQGEIMPFLSNLSFGILVPVAPKGTYYVYYRGINNVNSGCTNTNNQYSCKITFKIVREDLLKDKPDQGTSAEYVTAQYGYFTMCVKN